MKLEYNYKAGDEIKSFVIDLGDVEGTLEDAFEIAIKGLEFSKSKDANSNFESKDTGKILTIKSKNIISVKCLELNKTHNF